MNPDAKPSAVGAAVERDRTLRLLERMLHPTVAERVKEAVCDLGVRQVLGMPE